MKHYLIAGLLVAALSSGTAIAKNTHAGKHPAKVMTRAEKARHQIAEDLHWRGSNIPPAFSANGQWAR